MSCTFTIAASTCWSIGTASGDRGLDISLRLPSSVYGGVEKEPYKPALLLIYHLAESRKEIFLTYT